MGGTPSSHRRRAGLNRRSPSSMASGRGRPGTAPSPLTMAGSCQGGEGAPLPPARRRPSQTVAPHRAAPRTMDTPFPTTTAGSGDVPPPIVSRSPFPLSPQRLKSGRGRDPREKGQKGQARGTLPNPRQTAADPPMAPFALTPALKPRPLRHNRPPHGAPDPPWTTALLLRTGRAADARPPPPREARSPGTAAHPPARSAAPVTLRSRPPRRAQKRQTMARDPPRPAPIGRAHRHVPPATGGEGGARGESEAGGARAPSPSPAACREL